MTLSKNQLSVLKNVSGKLSIPPEWLYKLIKFESGFNPQAKNPYSTARGLIQFTDKTAQNLGFRDSLELIEKNKTIEKQLQGPVYNYLKKYAPFPTPQALYLSVFYPAYRYSSPDTLFSADIRAVNPGIYKVSDYVNKIEGLKVSSMAGILFFILAGAGVFYLTRKRGFNG